MRRRDYLRAVGGGATGVAAAGCLQMGGNSAETLRVGTYDSFVGEGSAGRWLKAQWEADHETTVEFTTPTAGVNEFVNKKRNGVGIDADLFVGLNTGELVRIDNELGDDTRLFDGLAADVSRSSEIKEALHIDPAGRALTYDTGYISLVYDGTVVDAPETFEALTTEPYAGTLLTQTAQNSDPGRAFLLWTIHEFGPDGYLDYWTRLVDNDVRVLNGWSESYTTFTEGERPMVVSYSTDRVIYNDPDDLPHHRVGFLNDQGYINPEAVARFADTDTPEVAAEFVEFMLSPERQQGIAERNAQFPATETASLPADVAEYGYEPPEPVRLTYDELAGSVAEWTETWAQRIATNVE
ncbi:MULTISPECIES: thiamine ABC transporter substrate-binding protein [Halobacterium]|uniref:thiamine ABC transporter substrate-binding protein n=1 Tax=Halobacterium TaxID=2239 RepID=UPI001F1CD737|nr:thiamine ABC transporter substrate binding subunit [Halobacterium salinarum]MCF2239103.1 thiamine ABC transporter substrate-binding protein [Halobacterium salinarum]WJK63888.1 thiamine ABC transporter substrate binding subunit [Halobacterium salinarum]